MKPSSGKQWCKEWSTWRFHCKCRLRFIKRGDERRDVSGRSLQTHIHFIHSIDKWWGCGRWCDVKGKRGMKKKRSQTVVNKTVMMMRNCIISSPYTFITSSLCSIYSLSLSLSLWSPSSSHVCLFSLPKACLSEVSDKASQPHITCRRREWVRQPNMKEKPTCLSSKSGKRERERDRDWKERHWQKQPLDQQLNLTTEISSCSSCFIFVSFSLSLSLLIILYFLHSSLCHSLTLIGLLACFKEKKRKGDEVKKKKKKETWIGGHFIFFFCYIEEKTRQRQDRHKTETCFSRLWSSFISFLSFVLLLYFVWFLRVFLVVMVFFYSVFLSGNWKVVLRIWI